MATCENDGENHEVEWFKLGDASEALGVIVEKSDQGLFFKFKTNNMLEEHSFDFDPTFQSNTPINGY